jgi:hypothetical protein
MVTNKSCCTVDRPSIMAETECDDRPTTSSSRAFDQIRDGDDKLQDRLAWIHSSAVVMLFVLFLLVLAMPNADSKQSSANHDADSSRRSKYKSGLNRSLPTEPPHQECPTPTVVAKGGPTGSEVGQVSTAISLQRWLIKNEELNNVRMFHDNDKNAMFEFGQSAERIRHGCQLLQKYGIESFLPYLPDGDKQFLIDDEFGSKGAPFFSRISERSNQAIASAQANTPAPVSRRTLEQFLSTVNHEAVVECTVQRRLLGTVAPVWLDRCADFSMYASYLGTTEFLAKRKFAAAIADCTSSPDLLRRLSK